MASPQREDGHLDVANELAEALARTRLNSTQSCLLWVILRKTYGWQKKIDTISLSQFAEATGIHRTQVARELGRLAARRIVIEWGDDHHPKQYGIQKDYTRWVGDAEVSTKTLTPVRKVSTDQLQSVNGSVAKVSTDQLTTITKKTTPTKTKGTDSHESAVSGTIFQQFEAKYRASTNKVAVLGELFSLLLGQKPNHGRLGSMAKRLNSGGRLLRLIIDAAQQTVSDDPHDYLEKLVQDELSGKGKPHESTGRPHRGTGRQNGRDNRRGAVGAPGSLGPGGYDSWRDES